MNIIFQFVGWKTFPIDAIAKTLTALDSTIVPYAHITFHNNTRFDTHIRERKNVNYKKIFSTEDMYARYRNDPLDMDYLKECEKKYGTPNLGNALYHERFLNPHIHSYGSWNDNPHIFKYTDEEILRWLQAHIGHIEHVFEESAPDAYVDIMAPGLYRDIIRKVCAYKKIPWLFPEYTRYKNYWNVTDNANALWPELEERYFELQNADNEQMEKMLSSLEEYRNAGRRSTEDPMSRPPKSRFEYTKESIKVGRIKNYVKSYIKHFRRQIDYTLNKKEWQTKSFRRKQPFGDMTARPKMVLKELYCNIKQLPQQTYEKNCPYYLYPLATVPEEQTEIRGQFFSNEVYVIESIAKSLPVDCKLYVKEHIPMINRRPLGFYPHLQEIPKVEVLSARTDIVDLLRNSLGVVTIAGTIGFEAYFLGKPLAILGQLPMDYLAGVFKIAEISQLPYILAEMRGYKPKDRQIASYMQAIADVSLAIPYETLFVQENGLPEYFEGDEPKQYLKIISEEILKKIANHSK